MSKWLHLDLFGTAYRIEVSWWVFASGWRPDAGIALLTVSTQAVRAALANPVESL